MRKTPPKKRVMRGVRQRGTIDATRLALSALDRIKTMLVKSGLDARLGEALGVSELARRMHVVGCELPPSYIAAMRIASGIGEPEQLLDAREMEAEAAKIIARGGDEARRYAPFCRCFEHTLCFDTGDAAPPRGGRHVSELPIIEWRNGSATPVAASFAEWLDGVADAREESIETAAKIPAPLKRLLYELGFRFEYPVIGRLETGDVAAIVDLIGEQVARDVRASVDRLFDSSGRASLTLNVDEFTLAVSLRTGIYVFEAEDIFRWLRTFRDENFFSDAVSVPSHPDQVRDLRLSPREPPLIQRGVLRVAVSPAEKLVFRGASGTGPDDFYLLGRTASTSERATSILLHVVKGAIGTAQAIEEPLNDVYVADDGTIWGLTATHAVRISRGRVRTFPLQRPTNGRPWWFGIGGAGDRILVWGIGALLQFDGDRFLPFLPDANLDEQESVIALHARGFRLWMLVCGDQVGAVARYDSAQWEPITENQVIEAALSDLDVWRSSGYVLDRAANVWKIDPDGPPARMTLHSHHEAYFTEAGTSRPIHGVRAFDGGLLLASDGGVISIGSGEPLFHAVPNGRDAVRLVRVGGRVGRTATPSPDETAIIAVGGPNAWIWRRGLEGQTPEASFDVIDTSAW